MRNRVGKTVMILEKDFVSGTSNGRMLAGFPKKKSQVADSALAVEAVVMRLIGIA
jgi:hypothetical protein